MQLVTGIPSPLLCFWTFNGGFSFFHAIAAFRLSSLFSGILRVSIFPPTLAFKEAVPLVKWSASVLSSPTKFLSSLHINALELFTIVVTLKHWAPQLQGRKFIVACNNSAAVADITSNASKDPFTQRCLRQMWFTTALFDFEVRALHVPGRHDQFVDYLSRWHSDPLAHDIFYCLCNDSGQVFQFQDVDSACFSFHDA